MERAPGLDMDAIEDVITQGLGAAKAQGLSIAPGSWGLNVSRGIFQPSGDYLCLVGASVLGIRPTVPRPTGLGNLAMSTFAARIGRSVVWVNHLVRAFDEGEAYPGTGFPYYHDAVALGKRFRRAYDAGQL